MSQMNDLATAAVFSTTPADSTATATMGGVYDGSQGTGPLRFKIAQGGVHGTDNLAIEIRDADDTLIETVNIASTDPLNQVYALSNGLSFQLSSGLLQADEWFAVGVNHLTPSAVDPDKAFNETGNDRPSFDDGLAVTAGSFDVNGVSIVVSATDTINSVLTKINQSAADVTAVFDAATESVVLTRNTIGPVYPIVVDNDTSGFLVATKLAGAVTTNGGISHGDTAIWGCCDDEVREPGCIWPMSPRKKGRRRTGTTAQTGSSDAARSLRAERQRDGPVTSGARHER